MRPLFECQLLYSLDVAMGEATELTYPIQLAEALGLGGGADLAGLEGECRQLRRRLGALIVALRGSGRNADRDR